MNEKNLLREIKLMVIPLNFRAILTHFWSSFLSFCDNKSILLVKKVGFNSELIFKRACHF